MKSSITVILLVLSFYSTVISQINDITRLPVQNSSQSIKESTPIWISENEIMIIYVLQSSNITVSIDTLYSSLSVNRGIDWQEPKIVQIVERNSGSQADLDLTSLKTSSSRILLVWTVIGEGMKIIYSDDKGESWSQPDTLLGKIGVFTEKNSRFLNLSLLDNNRIMLSFTAATGTQCFFRYSYDNGESWTIGNPYNFSALSGSNARELSLVSIGEDSLLAIFQMVNQGIYSKYSFDDGNTWTDTIRIADNESIETRPKIVSQDDGTLKLVYQAKLSTGIEDYEQNDVFYKISSDYGLTWTIEERFTRYVGEDNTVNVSPLGNKIFLSFATERFKGSYQAYINYQVAYAVINETTEQFTPPKVYWADVLNGSIDFEKREFIYQAKVIDDEAIDKVYVVYEDSSYKGELYDDGMHSDGGPNDTLYANTLPFMNANYFGDFLLDVNKIKMPMNDHGVLADINVSYGINLALEISDINGYSGYSEQQVNLGQFGSGGKFEEGSFMFSSGFFMSGYSGSYMWSNGVASASLLEDYVKGKVGSNPEDPANKFYVVYYDDPPFGYSWNNWKKAVSLGAEFYDGDGNGVYNPVDKNYNGTWDQTEDMPMLLGDVTVWCVYNDGKPFNQRRLEVEPQGIEIKQTVFASSLPELENIMFIRYSVLNTGTVSEVMDSVYFGFWADTDLGDHTEDLVGCDVVLNSGFVYNNDSDFVYGTNCPASFISLLQGPVIETGDINDTAYIRYGELLGTHNAFGFDNLNMTAHIMHVGGDPFLRDPSDKAEVRNYLKGQNRFGDTVDPCTFPYGEVVGGAVCDTVNPYYWFSGDPVTQYGWLSTARVDVRSIMGIGPFKLEKNKPQEIIGAYIVGRGTDYFNSITATREIVQRAIEEYKSNFASMTYQAPLPTKPVNSYILYQNYPNPFNPITTIRYELPEDGIVTIKVYDILGQEVKTILNEFKKADRYEIRFDAGGLASGVYIYRLQVNDFIKSKKMVLIK